MKNTNKALTLIFAVLFAPFVYGVAQAQSALENTATGTGALSSVTGSSYSNTADGDMALHLNTNSYDTAVGAGALYYNTGTANTAVGAFALNYNTTGAQNAAVGSFALESNTSGYDNTADNSFALFANTTGNNNTATGFGALMGPQYVTVDVILEGGSPAAPAVEETGSDNTANGYMALNSTLSGSQNTANGSQALAANTIGAENTANGYMALNLNTTGSNNTAEGVLALQNNTTGQSNTALGYGARSNLTTGDHNIEIGNPGATGDAATIRLGTQGTQTKTYVAGIFGATAARSVPVYVTSNGQLGTLTSSAKFKKNIKDMGNSSDALLALRPVTFQYKSEIDPAGTPQFGLIAEEVEKVSPDLVVHDADHQIYTVRYEAVNAMLLNEFQKQHETIVEQEKHAADQDKTIAEQQKLLQSLAARLDQMEQKETK